MVSSIPRVVTHHPKDGHSPSKIYQMEVYYRLGIWQLIDEIFIRKPQPNMEFHTCTAQFVLLVDRLNKTNLELTISQFHSQLELRLAHLSPSLSFKVC